MEPTSAAVGMLPTKEVTVLRGHEGAVLAVRFNKDGKYCLSCGKDRTLRLWNPYKGVHIKTYSGHARDVRDVAVSRHMFDVGEVRITCKLGFKAIPEQGMTLFYWDVSTGRIIRKFQGHDSEINSVKFNEFAAAIVSGGYDRSVRAWDCRSHRTDPIQVIDTFGDSVTSVVLTKTEIVAGCVDGTVRTFDIRNGREIIDNFGQSVNSVALSYDENCVLASCLDSTIRLLDRASGEQLQEYKGHVNKAFKMDSCLTNTDAHVVSGSEDGAVYFWDLVDGSVVTSFKAHASVVTGVSYHPSESCMLTSSVDSTVRMWRT